MTKALELFIGPCMLESEELALEVAGRITEDLKIFGNDVQLTFKGSFDKANRTSFDSYRGPGLEEGLRILERVKNTYNIPVITDIHLPEQADPVAKVVDVLQIPAFLCRQTDLVLAAAEACKKYDRRLNVKKGQFLSPEQAGNIVDKIATILPKEKILLTERGTTFGYGNLVVDMASFQIMKSFGVKTVHDATHSVQRPGSGTKTTGGAREHIEPLAKAAVAAGADCVFIEAHPDPAQAKSDAASQMNMKDVKGLVEKLIAIYKVVS